MGRVLSTAFCVALLVVSAAAFAITEGEKTALSALYATKVVTRAGKVLPGKVFSPTCDGRFPGCNRVGVIEFRTRAPGRVEVWIVSAATGKRVVTVIADRLSGAKALVRVVFYGRVGNRASGALLPDGSYLPVVKLLTQQLTFKLPNPIAIDTTPPKVIRPPRILHLALTPLKPGGPGIAVIAYRLEGPAHGVLFVDGHQCRVHLSPAAAGHAQLGWHDPPPARPRRRLHARDGRAGRGRQPVGALHRRDRHGALHRTLPPSRLGSPSR